MGDMSYDEAAEVCALSHDLKPDHQLSAMIKWAEANGKSIDMAISAYGTACHRLRDRILAERRQ